MGENTAFSEIWAKAEAAADAADGSSEKNSEGPSGSEGDPDGESGSTGSTSDSGSTGATGATGHGSDDDDDDESDSGKGKPLPVERVKFREYKRRQAEKIKRARAEVDQYREQSQAEIRQIASDLQQQFAPIMKAAENLKSGDLDAFAAAVSEAAGIDAKDWSGLNKHVLQRHSAPEYLEVQAMRRQLRERDEAERKQREQLERQQQTVAQQQAQQRYLVQLQTELTELGGASGILAKDDPWFVRAVFDVQMRDYDASSDTTTPTADAAKMVLEQVRKRHDLQLKAFSAQATTPEKKPPGAAVKNGKPAKTKNNQAQAGGSRKAGSRAESVAMWAQRLAESED